MYRALINRHGTSSFVHGCRGKVKSERHWTWIVDLSVILGCCLNCVVFIIYPTHYQLSVHACSVHLSSVNPFTIINVFIYNHSWMYLIFTNPSISTFIYPSTTHQSSIRQSTYHISITFAYIQTEQTDFSSSINCQPGPIKCCLYMSYLGHDVCSQ